MSNDNDNNGSKPIYKWQLDKDGKPRTKKRPPSFNSLAYRGQHNGTFDNSAGIKPFASADPMGEYMRAQWRITHPLEHAIQVLTDALNGVPLRFPNGDIPEYRDEFELAARLDEYKDALARREKKEQIPHERTKPSINTNLTPIRQSKGPWS